MSYNDPTDVEAVLEVPASPPALTPSGVPVPQPSGPPLPIQRQPSPRGASAQLTPVEPPPPVIDPATQTPLTVDGVDATPQTPQTTQPGVLDQS